MRFQPGRQIQRVRGMRLHAQAQRFQSLQQHPGIECGQGRPGGTQEGVDTFHQRLAAQHRAAEYPALPVQILGGGMDNDVSAELQRPLQSRRAEAVVHRQPGANFMCNVGQRTDVADLGQRIGRRFDEEQTRIRLHRRAPLGGIGRRNESRLDAETAQDVLKQLHGGAKDRARGDDMLASAHQTHHRGQNRRHAGSKSDATFSAFQGCQSFLEHADAGIGETCVDRPGFGAGKARGGFGGAAENEAGSQEHRLGMFLELAALGAGAHSQGVGMQACKIHDVVARFRSICRVAGAGVIGISPLRWPSRRVR